MTQREAYRLARLYVSQICVHDCGRVVGFAMNALGHPVGDNGNAVDGFAFSEADERRLLLAIEQIANHLEPAERAEGGAG